MKDDNKSTFHDIFVSLKKCYLMIINYDKKYIRVTILVTTFLGITPAISTKVMQVIINKLQIGETRIVFFFYLIILYSCIDIVNTIVTSIYSYYKQKFSANFDKYIKLKMQKKAADIPLKYYEDSKTYNTINRAQNQNGSTILTFIDSFSSIIKCIITIISTIAILSGYHLELILLILVFPIIKYLITIKIVKLQYDIEIKRTDKQRKIWYIDYLFLMGLAYKEIKLYGLKTYLSKQYENLKDKIIFQDISIAKKSIVWQSILSVADQIVSGAVFCFYVVSGIKKIILIGDVITYTKCIFTIKTNLESILNIFNTVAQSALYIDFLFQFLDLDIDDMNKIEIGYRKIEKIEKIELDNVSYKYQGTTKYALKNVSLTINKGETIAIVGKNGSGKSTLLKIILGFYTDYKGTIKINDIDLKTIEKSSYYKLIGCIFQDYIKYETTIRENIGFGNLNELNNDKKINNFITSLRLDGVASKSDGLETILGSWFGNKQVSIGQWQRIAIARALYKNADLYILDEPDSSLDAEAESNLLKLYKKIFKNNLGVYITHKITSVKSVTDKIIVLNDGIICEQGNHQELYMNKGIYYQLYSIQEKKYNE